MAKPINFDRLGVVAGSACAVHCLLSGIALSFLSVVGLKVIASEAVELGFFVVTGTLGMVGVVHGFSKHKAYWPALLFIAGLISIWYGHQLVGHNHESASQNPWATVISVFGGLFLVAFHISNLRLGKRAGCGCV